MTTLEKPLLQRTAADLMTRDVTVIPQHLSLKAAAHLLAQANVSGAPVIDEFGRCVGVLSTPDLVQWVDRGARAAKRIGTASACVCADWQIIAMDLMPEDEVGRYMTTDVVSTRQEADTGCVLARALLKCKRQRREQRAGCHGRLLRRTGGD